MTDSIVKYAEKSVLAKDSTADAHIADQVHRVQALHNYDRFRLEADRLSMEAGEARQKITFLSLMLSVMVTIVVLVIIVVVVRRHRKRTKRLRLRIRYTADTLLFKTFNEELGRSARQPERQTAIAQKIRFLEESLSRQSESLKAEALTESFQESDLLHLLHRKNCRKPLFFILLQPRILANQTKTQKYEKANHRSTAAYGQHHCSQGSPRRIPSVQG